MRELRKCPKCGERQMRAATALDGLISIQCGVCGYGSRSGYKTFDVAVTAWNSESRIAWGEDDNDD